MLLMRHGYVKDSKDPRKIPVLSFGWAQRNGKAFLWGLSAGVDSVCEDVHFLFLDICNLKTTETAPIKIS